MHAAAGHARPAAAGVRPFATLICCAHCAALCRRDPWPAVQSLPQFLRGFEGPDPLPTAYSGLGVHWIIFGSSGHKGRPSGGVLRAYSRCLQLRHGQHTVVKTIVRTA